MTTNKKILVAYYSYSGNTKTAAEIIRQNTGGDLLAIETAASYPAVYNELTAQAKKEIDAGYKPSLKENAVDMDKYDVVFLGSPNWWYTIAPAVATFLTSHDFSGKTVIPFITHGGGGLAHSISDVKKLVPSAVVTEGKAIGERNVSNKEIGDWAVNILNKVNR